MLWRLSSHWIGAEGHPSTFSILGLPPVLYLFKLQPHCPGPVGNLESPKQGHTREPTFLTFFNPHLQELEPLLTLLKDTLSSHSLYQLPRPSKQLVCLWKINLSILQRSQLWAQTTPRFTNSGERELFNPWSKDFFGNFSTFNSPLVVERKSAFYVERKENISYLFVKR